MFSGLSSATFNGVTGVKYSHTLFNTSSIRTFSFKIRTLSKNGWILQIENGNQHYKARLTGSYVVISYKLGSSQVREVVAPLDVSDSKWYLAVVMETDTILTLTLSEEDNEAVSVSVSGNKESGTQLTSLIMDTTTEIVVGNPSGIDNQRDPYLHGCLKEVRIGKILLPFFDDDLFVNNTSTERFLLESSRALETGCQAGSMCRYSQCKYGTCVEDFYDYQCNCTAGYSGRWCDGREDYCTLDSCANGQCVSTMDNFQCRCPAGYSGERYVNFSEYLLSLFSSR